MARQMVALIRGINVGKAKRVAMADLRGMMGRLGFRETKTLLNSGNIVFRAASGEPPAIASRIQEGISKSLGVSAGVTVLTAEELAEAIARRPFPEIADNPSRLLVAVPARPEDRSKLEPLTGRVWTPEAFALGTRVAYLWCPQGVLASPLHKAVSQTLENAVTARNWSTMLKLGAKVRS